MKKLWIMLEISVLILIFAGWEEHFHQIICLYPSVIQPFHLFRNCQFDFRRISLSFQTRLQDPDKSVVLALLGELATDPHPLLRSRPENLTSRGFFENKL